MWRKASYYRSASFAAISALPVILGCAQANALTFDFTFGAGTRSTVTGEIDGLSDNSTGPASAVIVDSVTPNNANVQPNFPAPPLTLPVTVTDMPTWTVSANDFTVSNSQITAADFMVRQTASTGNLLCFNIPGGTCPVPGSLQAALSGGNGVFLGGTPTFTLTSAPPTPEIPLPATLPLFASGLGALGLLGRRWKRKSPASVLAA